MSLVFCPCLPSITLPRLYFFCHVKEFHQALFFQTHHFRGAAGRPFANPFSGISACTLGEFVSACKADSSFSTQMILNESARRRSIFAKPGQRFGNHEVPSCAFLPCDDSHHIFRSRIKRIYRCNRSISLRLKSLSSEVQAAIFCCAMTEFLHL